jgi:outer membrane immunogenic protein
MKAMTLSVAALAAFVSTAGAADLPPREPVRAPAVVMPPPARNWTGCYIGGGFGYGMWNQEITAVSGSSAKVTAGGRGYLGTAQFGCDYQAGNFVVGAFGDGDFGSLKGNVGFGSVYGEEKEKWSWAAGARVGYLVTPQLLGFFSAGYTQAHFDQVNLLLLAAPGVSAGLYVPQTTYSGWFLGSGYEYGISWWPGLFWKTEYRFSDFGSERIQFLNTGTGTPSGAALDSHKYIQTIRSELVWRF